MTWRPIHDAHALERVTTLFRFGSTAPSKLWQNLLSNASTTFSQHGLIQIGNANEDASAAALLPGKPGALPMPFVMNPGGLIMGALGNPFGAGSTRHYRTEEGSEEIVLSPSFFIYTAHVYDRWKAYEQRLQLLIVPLLGKVLSWTSLSQIKLECWDRFTYDGLLEEADFGKLLRSTSPLVPTFTATIRDQWHSHVGFFIPTTVGSRLFNLNIDVTNALPGASGQADAQPQAALRSVGIYSMTQDTYPIEDNSPSTGESAVNKLQEMHIILKAKFADVISDDMCEMISLDRRESECFN